MSDIASFFERISTAVTGATLPLMIVWSVTGLIALGMLLLFFRMMFPTGVGKVECSRGKILVEGRHPSVEIAAIKAGVIRDLLNSRPDPEPVPSPLSIDRWVASRRSTHIDRRGSWLTDLEALTPSPPSVPVLSKSELADFVKPRRKSVGGSSQLVGRP